ncbi:hypothetical protein LTR28_001157, partial [Elasticomyces elasticus]
APPTRDLDQDLALRAFHASSLILAKGRHSLLRAEDRLRAVERLLALPLRLVRSPPSAVAAVSVTAAVFVRRDEVRAVGGSLLGLPVSASATVSRLVQSGQYVFSLTTPRSVVFQHPRLQPGMLEPRTHSSPASCGRP